MPSVHKPTTARIQKHIEKIVAWATDDEPTTIEGETV
jgi:hypothetical protein